MKSQSHRQVVFTLGMLLWGVLAALLAFGSVGLPGVEGAGYSVALCLIPGWLTIFAGDLLKGGSLGVYVVLIGTGLRMFFVLVGLFVVGSLRPDLGFREFVVWLLVSYLVSLALETWMVLLPSKSEAA
jgi:hypothetical protein